MMQVSTAAACSYAPCEIMHTYAKGSRKLSKKKDITKIEIKYACEKIAINSLKSALSDGENSPDDKFFSMSAKCIQ
jgi:hypothetical protein